MGCWAELRVRYPHWEYKDSLGKSDSGQSLTQVRFMKRWKDFVDSCSRAAGTALSHCRLLGRDSTQQPLGLGSDNVATGEDTGTADGEGGERNRLRRGRDSEAKGNFSRGWRVVTAHNALSVEGVLQLLPIKGGNA